jgi:nicotinate-nucleotide adenylyltransferase
MRIGIFGGTFDPPHVGHLLAASDAFEQLSLDRLLFVPAGAQPFKVGDVQAGGAARLEMLRLMIGDDDRFRVEAAEIERGGLSFTVDTVTELAQRHAGARLFLLLGEDNVTQFASWREPERIASLATIAVLARGGAPVLTAAAANEAYPMMHLETRRVDVSSTEIRARVREGRSIRGFVSDAVAEYIRAAGLYR